MYVSVYCTHAQFQFHKNKFSSIFYILTDVIGKNVSKPLSLSINVAVHSNLYLGHLF